MVEVHAFSAVDGLALITLVGVVHEVRDQTFDGVARNIIRVAVGLGEFVVRVEQDIGSPPGIVGGVEFVSAEVVVFWHRIAPGILKSRKSPLWRGWQRM